MIEQIMYFLLGVLLATLVALLVLPAVWHRAVRLTTRRVEAAVPVSLFEVQADKDQQRAFFALNQRRLEIQIEEMRATIAAHAATIESQRRRIVELEGQISELTQSGEKTGAVAAERQVLVGELEDQVADLKSRIATLETELTGARAGHADLQSAHGVLSKKAEELTTSLAARDASIVDHGERATVLSSEVALLTTNLTATAQRLDVTSDLLEKERASVARLNGELNEVRASLAATEAESAERAAKVEALSGERDQLNAALSTAKGDLDASHAVLHAFEQRRASEFAEAEAETRRITSTLDMVRADHALMAGALEKARGDGAAPQDGAAPDLDAVKAMLADMAARVVTLTTRLEGEASPVPALLAGDGAAPSTAGDGPSLAERIRTLLGAPEGSSASAHAAPNGGQAGPAPASSPAGAQAQEAGTTVANGAEAATEADGADTLVAEPAHQNARQQASL